MLGRGVGMVVACLVGRALTMLALRRGIIHQLQWEQGRKEKSKRTLPIDRIGPYNILQVTITRRELPILRGGGHVIRAPNKIVYVQAVVGRSDAVVTGFEAELAAAHESMFRGKNQRGRMQAEEWTI
jgi:hypothetical protein